MSIKLWSQGLITIGDFALIQAYLINATDRLWNFGHIIRQMYEAFADATEMVEILDLPHEVQDKLNASELKVGDEEEAKSWWRDKVILPDGVETLT